LISKAKRLSGKKVLMEQQLSTRLMKRSKFTKRSRHTSSRAASREGKISRPHQQLSVKTTKLESQKK
jgi:hypothetical protein